MLRVSIKTLMTSAALVLAAGISITASAEESGMLVELREIGALAVSPVRGFNRLISGRWLKVMLVSG